jgi:hypothetical protein
MNKEEFDYYVFVDYSENLIGYIIIAKEKISELLPKISRLKHYKGLKNKIQYLNAIKKTFEKNKILDVLSKYRITELRQNVEICSEIFDFCHNCNPSKMFISVDDRQYKGFMKLASLMDNKRFKIIKEGQLKKGSSEYQMNLIIDTLLNLKRTRQNE